MIILLLKQDIKKKHTQYWQLSKPLLLLLTWVKTLHIFLFMKNNFNKIKLYTIFINNYIVAVVSLIREIATSAYKLFLFYIYIPKHIYTCIQNKKNIFFIILYLSINKSNDKFIFSLSGVRRTNQPTELKIFLQKF